MLKKSSRSVEDLTAAETLEELRSSLAVAVYRLGFVNYNISLNKRHAVEFMEEPTLTTWSANDLTTYANTGWAPRDPLLHNAVEKPSAFLWRASDWEGTEHAEYAEYLGVSGIRGGATVPLSQKPGRLGAMTLLSVTDEPLTDDTLLGVQIIAHLALARTSALTYGLPRFGQDPRGLQTLSGQQLEILRWVARGKTNREIAIIMGSTRRAIDYHMQEILSKLGVSSRTQAVAILASRES